MLPRIGMKVFLGCCLIFIWAAAAPALHAADVTHGRDCATAVTIRAGVEQSATFTSMSDRAVFRIVLDRRGLLDVADMGNSGAAKVDLLDSSCNAIGAGSTESMITGEKSMLAIPSNLWTLAPGVYFLRFDPAGPKASNARFSFEALFTPHYGHDCATAEPMNLGESRAGELLYLEDKEVFRLVVDRPGQLHVYLSDAPGAPLVDLYTEGCSFAAELQMDEETGMGFVTPRLTPGFYYVIVSPAPHATPGPFMLNVVFHPAPDVDYEWSDVPL